MAYGVRGKPTCQLYVPSPQFVYPLAGLGYGALLSTARVTASAYKHALGSVSNNDRIKILGRLAFQYVAETGSEPQNHSGV